MQINRKRSRSRSKDSFDMFQDDSLSPLSKSHQQPSLRIDNEGFIQVSAGETLGEWRVLQRLGKGMFGLVLKCEREKREGAVKVLRNNETMVRSGLNQISILGLIHKKKTLRHRHIIKLEQSFNEGPFLCLVYQLLGQSLRTWADRVRPSLTQMSQISFQVFSALNILQACKIIHADIKPDNLLWTKDHSHLVLTDFGSALNEADIQIFDYLVALFYRAPELILGCKYDERVDVWSMGCVLFQVYSGKYLFQSYDNADLLKKIITGRGSLPDKMITTSKFKDKYFQDQFFLGWKIDVHQGKKIPTKERLSFQKDLLDSLTSAHSPQEVRKLAQFKDLLRGCLAVNPKQRLRASQALKHPFVREGRQSEQCSAQLISGIYQRLKQQKRE